MTSSILLVGVGGQGTILISRILSNGLMEMGFDVKMSEIHGMSQRGGSVTTQIRYGEKVFAPNIGAGEADVIVAFEKIEALRSLPFLKKDGRVILDEREIYPMPVLTGSAQYPHQAIDELKSLVSRVTVIPAARIAEELGNIRAQNIVLLGALTKVLKLDEKIDWRDLVAKNVPPKAKDLNLAAYDAGQKSDIKL
ncbi:MAG: indolepyruvate oxidoreductase subunit beta [Synergistaceae bacterium]|jgi:indolepyruvate ferredoxin oxidoreductase beta subunit|nr:indolepyruvate oxidoreductase subunit beta [Synergistaceae bacterium]